MSLPTPRPHQRSMHPAKREALVRRIDVGWQDQALCRKFPDDDWFPAPATAQVVAELVEVCQRCSAQTSCLAAALAMGEEHGIWGGTTEADRHHAVSALGHGASVPQVLDRLLTGDQAGDDGKRGEAA
jgi:WhiB family transcriptional regulator, redox-sensing transcriptional regulator